MCSGFRVLVVILLKLVPQRWGGSQQAERADERVTESHATAGQLLTVQRITIPIWAWAGGAEHDDTQSVFTVERRWRPQLNSITCSRLRTTPGCLPGCRCCVVCAGSPCKRRLSAAQAAGSSRSPGPACHSGTCSSSGQPPDLPLNSSSRVVQAGDVTAWSPSLLTWSFSPSPQKVLLAAPCTVT